MKVTSFGVWLPATEVWNSDVYYERNTYTLTYLVDGEVYLEEEYKYEAQIILPDDPKKSDIVSKGLGQSPRDDARQMIWL